MINIVFKRVIHIVYVIIGLGLFLLVIVADPNNKTNSVFVGSSKVDVTPKFPVVLAGYGGRTQEFEGIDTKLWARCLVIGKEDPAVLVVIDNCGITSKIKNDLAERIKKFGISESNLVISATHTHNAPSLRGYAPILWAGRTSPNQEDRIDKYTSFLIDQMESLVVNALENREPMKLSWGRGEVQFGGNRRIIRDGKWAGFGFQRNGPVDHSLPVMVATDLKGETRVIWSNYACHCTTIGGRNHINGDWAGYANELIEKNNKSAISLLTIGCGADVGPQPSGGSKDAIKHGSAISKEVNKVISDDMTPLPGVTETAVKELQLPLQQPKDRKHWQSQLKVGGFHAELAKSMLKKIDEEGSISSEVKYPIHTWKFGQELAVVFLAGEVVVDYAVRFNKEFDWKRLWISAWANDMPGYIPSRRILNEGGYEAEFSQVYYDLPGPYLPEVEDIMTDGVRELLGKEYIAKKNQEPPSFHEFPSSEPATFKKISHWFSELTVRNNSQANRLKKLIHSARAGCETIIQEDGEITEWYNFSGDFNKRVFIRQSKKGTSMSWKSVVSKETDTQVFSFSGGLGWVSEPMTDGFLMSINDQHQIKFDVTKELSSWKSQDDLVELFYLPTWTSEQDSSGFFFIHFSDSVTSLGEVLNISISSLGSGSKRWFGLDSVQKFDQRIKLLREALK